MKLHKRNIHPHDINSSTYKIVLMVKEETVLQGMIDKLIEKWWILRHGNECGKNKSNENFKTTITSNN